jgi:hypothetical protein
MLSFARKTRPLRRRVNKQAWLVFDGEFALRPCTVIDMSDNGARLSVDQSDRLPKRFSLTFSRASRAGLQCEVRWKHGQAVGVKFVGS